MKIIKTVPFDECKSLECVQRIVEHYRRKQESLSNLKKRILFFEKVESFTHHMIYLAISVLLLRYTILEIDPANVDWFKSTLSILHGVGMVIGCVGIIFKCIQITESYFRFKTGYGDRIFKNYIRNYFDKNPID